MGDVVGLVNEAMEKFDKDETERLTAKMESGNFTLDDFMAQMNQVRKLGPIGKIMGMIPGMSQMTAGLNLGDGQMDRQLVRMEAIYRSMTAAERKKVDMLDGSRRRRISAGAGVGVNEVGQFIKQFEMARDVMRAYGQKGMGSKMQLMKGLMSGGAPAMAAGGGGLKTKRSGYMEKKDRNKKGKR
jgi:signal recognition particle subunit SRP54